MLDRDWRLVIPIHDEAGELVAYCGRSPGGAEPRYKFPAGFPKSQVLFNLHRAAAGGTETVIVVEGFFDCLRVHQAGFSAVVALMGSALYERQRWLLSERFRKIVLMLDGDPTGRRASATVAARLAGCSLVRVIELAAGLQPGQLSEQAIRQILTKEGGESKNC
ncbi:MAG TPA: toprim domain-containing protein [Bryobacteraceae bacterium]|nr:toprim domain-containing protein [Bryobacteraceae bacterium]